MSDEQRGSSTVDPRTLQALERTLLAWLRTGVGLITFAFVVGRLNFWLTVTTSGERSVAGARWIGGLLALLGTAAEVLALVRYISFRRALIAGRPIPLAHGPVLAFAASVATIGGVLGVLVMASLF